MRKEIRFQVQAAGKGITTHVVSGDHQFIVDEPAGLGGTGSGPNPLEYVLGALAGCEEATAQMIAQRSGFQLHGIRFHIEGSLDPRGFAGVTGARPYFQQVHVHAVVNTPETEERLHAFQAAVEQRCPVFTLIQAAGVEMKAHWERKIPA